eukprot:SAG31_NODE_2854_length_4992_cov_3.213570_5_plen_94_part_00
MTFSAMVMIADTGGHLFNCFEPGSFPMEIHVARVVPLLGLLPRVMIASMPGRPIMIVMFDTWLCHKKENLQRHFLSDVLEKTHSLTLSQSCAP